jgi:hypothetical protein
MILAKFGLRLLKTLLDGPPNAAEPYEAPQFRTDRSVTDVVCVLSVATQSPFDNQAHRLARESFFAKGNASFGKFILYGSFGSLGNFPPIPEE